MVLFLDRVWWEEKGGGVIVKKIANVGKITEIKRFPQIINYNA